MSEQREREILDRLDNAHAYSAGGMSTQAGDDVRYLYEQLGVARGNIIAALACVERAEARADEAERLAVEIWDMHDWRNSIPTDLESGKRRRAAIEAMRARHVATRGGTRDD